MKSRTWVAVATLVAVSVVTHVGVAWAQEGGDVEAGRAIAEFYAAAKEVVAGAQTEVGGMRFGGTWEELLYGDASGDATSAYAALAAAVKELEGALAAQPGRELRLESVVLTASGPELSFRIGEGP